MGKVFLLILFYLWSSGAAPAQEGSGRTIDEKMQMELGDYFFKEGDYYRAITEYRRFLFFFPQSEKGEEALWKISNSYFRGKKWDEDLWFANELLKKFPGCD